jgi:hypothetical protein
MVRLFWGGDARHGFGLGQAFLDVLWDVLNCQSGWLERWWRHVGDSVHS